MKKSHYNEVTPASTDRCLLKTRKQCYRRENRAMLQ